MKISIIPQSTLGKWSLGLIILMPLLFTVGMSFVDFYEDVPAGQSMLGDIINRPGVALPMLSGFAAGIAACVTGLIAILKKKDRAILTFISAIIGTLLVIFLIMEVVFPH